MSVYLFLIIPISLDGWPKLIWRIEDSQRVLDLLQVADQWQVILIVILENTRRSATLRCPEGGICKIETSATDPFGAGPVGP
jgi:hypothetical protein